MGAMLRCHWMPIAGVTEFDAKTRIRSLLA
jgi:hypothetical protein